MLALNIWGGCSKEEKALTKARAQARQLQTAAASLRSQPVWQGKLQVAKVWWQHNHKLYPLNYFLHCLHLTSTILPMHLVVWKGIVRFPIPRGLEHGPLPCLAVCLSWSSTDRDLTAACLVTKAPDCDKCLSLDDQSPLGLILGSFRGLMCKAWRHWEGKLVSQQAFCDYLFRAHSSRQILNHNCVLLRNP